MEICDFEDMVTEMGADAKAIVTLALDVTDNPSDEDGNKLHAILKLAEDQIQLTNRMSTMLAAME